jgi:hypothetical protein
LVIPTSLLQSYRSRDVILAILFNFCGELTSYVQILQAIPLLSI